MKPMKNHTMAMLIKDGRLVDGKNFASLTTKKFQSLKNNVSGFTPNRVV